jgi:hypothetical protein
MALGSMQQRNMMMKKSFYAFNLAVVILIGMSFTQLHAQENHKISIKETYPLILKDFKHEELIRDIIQLFENNFTELIDDIENTATIKDQKGLVQFLKTEFNHYADVLPLQRHDPEKVKTWIRYKQKEYRCMILGRKIKALDTDHNGDGTAETYKSQLKSLLAETLEIKLDKENQDIIALEKRLEELKNIHQARTKNKDKILQNRYDELVGNRQLFQW